MLQGHLVVLLNQVVLLQKEKNETGHEIAAVVSFEIKCPASSVAHLGSRLNGLRALLIIVLNSFVLRLAFFC